MMVLYVEKEEMKYMFFILNTLVIFSNDSLWNAGMV